MDNAGWHANRRARKENEAYYAQHRAYDGRLGPVEQVTPMDESFIGGFVVQPPPSPRPPSVPPKDYFHLTGPRRPPYAPSHLQPGPSTLAPEQLATMSAVERSQALRVARMEPHLQFMCGPLLRYDTVDEHGIWHGAALVVTADSGSIYLPHPILTYEWDPDARNRDARPIITTSFDLGPHPADPHSTVMPGSPTFSNGNANRHARAPSTGKNVTRETVQGEELWVYAGQGGTFTFWRFLIKVLLSDHEMAVSYTVNHGQTIEFWVPGRSQNFRWAAHSCNGFSAGVNPDDFRGPGYKSGYDPLWVDLLQKHAESPFHVLVGGGDQLYCDIMMRESEMQDWVSRMKPEEKKAYPLSSEMAAAIDRFLFSHYCQHFRSGAFARANCSIPMLNMCDDHDLIDGFGSYPEDLQMAPVFRAIGSRGYYFFLLFQCFINPEKDGMHNIPRQHVFQSTIMGDMGPYVPYPSHSFLAYLGPRVRILMLDCRAERKKNQVCSQGQYKKVFRQLETIPPEVDHLVIQLGIPIAYPRMVFLETALESKLNPLVALGRNGTMGLSGFVNKFNAEAELLDDLNDHWTARSHKKERNWFIEQLQNLAIHQHSRVTFLSGDVHCAAVGILKTLKQKNSSEIPSDMDHRYMMNIVTSAIVNTPPPNAVLSLVSSLATKVHKTLHGIETDETMLPLFTNDPNGHSRKQKYIMGRRNWCQVDWDKVTGELIFDIRVEKEKGYGETEGYAARVPPPRWGRGG